MKNIYSNKSDDFAFEKRFCFQKPIVWLHEAQNLFYSAEVLYEFDDLKYRDILDQKNYQNLFSKSLTGVSYFNHRVQRMLWAYGFENLFKGIIITQYKIDHAEIYEVPLQIIQSHQLSKLAIQAGISGGFDDPYYLEILSKCSIWAGRYPMPIKEKDMPVQRVSMKSHEELIQRSMLVYSELKSGNIKRVECEVDTLQTGIGRNEIMYYRDLQKKSTTLFRSLLGDN